MLSIRISITCTNGNRKNGVEVGGADDDYDDVTIQIEGK